MDSGVGGVLLVLGGLIASLLAYFAPAIIANRRRKANAGSIFVLNLFLGLTVVGWVVALVWALAEDRQPILVQAGAPALSRACGKCGTIGAGQFCPGCGAPLTRQPST